MDEAWAARIMALEKDVAELKEAVLAVQERDGKPMKAVFDTEELIAAIGPKIDAELRSLANHGTPESWREKS